MARPAGERGEAGFARDEGLQNERTALAWQRTALSLVAGAAVMARLTWGSLGAGALTLLAAAVGLALWVFVESRNRYAHSARVRRRPRPRGGRAPLALATAATLVAATELWALLAA